MKKLLIGMSFLIITAAAVILVPGNRSLADTSTAEITVNVNVDIPGNPPLEGATIYCEAREAGYKFTYTRKTDSGGTGKCLNIPTDPDSFRVKIRVSKNGFRTQEVTQPVNISSQQYTKTITLDPTKCTVSGYVKDDNNDPVGGATVVTPSTHTSSNSNGYFEFNNIPFSDGTTKVRASESGYITSDWKTVDLNTSLLSFDAGTLTLYRDIGTVTGKITGGLPGQKKSQAISGATVRCGGKTVRTRRDGSFTIREISSGSYDLRVRKDGYNGKEIDVTIKGREVTDVGILRLDMLTPSKEDKEKAKESRTLKR